jgi:hypothetical protein
VVNETVARSGACHCGAVRFTVALPAELRGARCDCSICSTKGAVTVGAPLDALEIVEGADLLTLYQFNTGVAKHWFCSRCGPTRSTSAGPIRTPMASTSPASASIPTTTFPTCRWWTASTTRATPAKSAWPGE